MLQNKLISVWIFEGETIRRKKLTQNPGIIDQVKALKNRSILHHQYPTATVYNLFHF